jgi:hypothetical protein
MHFDQRTQAALRAVGLSMDEIRAASDRVVAATQDTASNLETFFHGREIVYSDMDRAHSASEIQEHAVEFIDLYTHAADLRGYLRFDSWGVPVEGERVLDVDTDDDATNEVIELTLGSTVHDRVRFATDPDHL